MTKNANLNSWITLKEFPKFLKLAIWATRETKYSQEYKLLYKRVEALVKSNGFNFTFLYLKECLRIVTLYLAGTPSFTPGKVRVKVNQYGLPVIIPAAIRRDLGLSEGMRMTTRCTLTVLSIFRTFPTKVKPDLSSITDAFSGLSRTLEIEQVVKGFGGKHKLSFGPIKGFISESAGPIAKKATWGASIDAVALLRYPRVAYRVISILFAQRAFGYIISLLALWAINGPIYIFICSVGLQKWLPIGKLSIVYDQAGKARVVAMANWWVQLVLRPLHKSIFGLLKDIKQDGTFHQDGPLELIRESPNVGHHFSCFDLSSATDRLPVDLQVQVLNAFGVDGHAWKDLFSYPWYYKGKPVEYSVGQPMGAYSSWAMLALTHHLIVKLAAVQVGEKNFTNYALLGDDIVINHDGVAERYLELMKVLGVGINMSKSVVSSEIMEFAKRLVSPSFELSPIGAGNLLLVSRRSNMIGSLLAELYNKSIVTDSDTVVRLIESFPFAGKLNFLVLWTYFGSCRHLFSARLTSTFMEVWNTYGGSQLIYFSYGYHLFSALRSTLWGMVEKAAFDAAREEQRFYRGFIKATAVKGLSIGFLESLGLFLSPAIYLYALELNRARVHAETQWYVFERGRNMRPDKPELLLDFQDFGGLSIKWSKKQAQEYGRFIKKLETNIDVLSRSEAYD